jgi:macrolide-specific efflux system membrane fusion protein
LGALTFVEPAAGGPPNAARIAPPAGSITPPPGGFRPGGLRGTGAGRGAPTGPRKATVKVVAEDGTQHEQEVTVGVTSRVSAEVISGLKEGDKVVAGIIQQEPVGGTPPPQQGGPGGGNFQFRPF